MRPDMRPRALMTPRNLGEHHSPTPISHAIPPPLFQILNPHRWNYALFSPLSICLTTELHAKLVGSFRGPQSFARQRAREAFYSPSSTTVASTPRTHTSSSPQRFTGSHELLSTFLKSHGPHMSESDRCTNCDGLRTHAMAVCGRPLCFAIAWFLLRSKLLAERLIERFGRDKL